MVDSALQALKSYDWGADRKPINEINQAVVDTYGDDAARKELEGKLAAALAGDLSYDAKQHLCRKLRVIGTAASVPTLAALLGDAKLSHMARYALEDIPGKEAADAVRDALGKVDGNLKVGMLSTLGVRQDEASVATIAKLIGDGDTAVARAAATALGAIGSPAAAKALDQSKPADDVASAVSDASFICAENLLANGKNTDALAIYKGLATGDRPKHVKLAATRGMLACAGKK